MNVDIIIPNYNGATLLPTCLDALRLQTRRDFLVTVVDDGSTDSSVALLAERYPEVNVIALAQNGGLVRAVNCALAQTRGQYVVLLNNDAEADSTWLAALIGALERFPGYDFAASKLRLFDQRDRLHSAGDGYSGNGRPFNRGVWQLDHGQFDAVTEVGAHAPVRQPIAARRWSSSPRAVPCSTPISLCTARMSTLNLRARLAGIRTVFVPQAVVYHRLSATGGGPLASYWVGRNCIAVWVKNMPATLLRRHLVSFLFDQAGIAVDALRHHKGAAARARLRGQLAGLRSLVHFVRKRRCRRQLIADERFAMFLGS